MQTYSRRIRSLTPYALAVTIAGGGVLAASCAHSAKPIGPGGFDNQGDDGGNSGILPPPGLGTAPSLGVQCTAQNPCNDFPSTPFMDGNVPSNVASLFGNAGTGNTSGGPCIYEPQDNTLFPHNWLRPRVWFTASGSQNLFEIRFHSDAETNDLVAYTSNTTWTLDNTKDASGHSIWDNITSRVVGTPIVVTVRGVGSGGGTPTVSASSTFRIAPADAGGALIYWTTASFDKTATNTTLQGFQVGDEGTVTALVSDQVQQPVRAQLVDAGPVQPATFNPVFCIGCHTVTPDGAYVAFTSQWPWANALATIQADASVGAAPPWLTPGAVSNMSPNLNGYYQPPSLSQVMMGIQTFSPAHYQAGDRKVVGALGASWNQTDVQLQSGSPGSATGVVSQLAWFDLEYAGAVPTGTNFNSGSQTSPLPIATPCTAGGGCVTSVNATGGWGIVARNGDPNSAGAPSWSHNAGGTDLIAYASTDVGTKDGRMDCSAVGTPCKSDVFTVPYNSGQGGTASPLPGASDPAYNEYYPAWSPDDNLIAFNRVPSGTSMYNQPAAEVYIVPFNGGSGGTPTRLAANDPPMCSNRMSPGVQNTWPKWAPNVETDTNGKQYYWVTFSSTRHPKSQGKQQLFVAGVVYNPDTKTFETYSGIYLWNQSYLFNNLIPSWQNLQIAHGTTLPPT